MTEQQQQNKGHGHVVPRPDGVKARCGGPGLCKVCQQEKAALSALVQQPTISATWDQAEDGTFVAKLRVYGLASEEQAKAELRRMRGALSAQQQALPPLLPCPFCGNAAPELEDNRTIWVVRCKCAACVVGERAPEPDGTETDDYWERIRQTAIDAWNRRAASAPSRETPGWLPIETAPKDRTEILGWTPDCGALVLYWEDLPDAGRWSDGMLPYFHRQPTHWMPLPAAPSTPVAAEENKNA